MNEDQKAQFVQRVRAAIKSKGVPLGDIATRFALKTSAVEKWFTRDSIPKEYWKSLASMLQIEIDTDHDEQSFSHTERLPVGSLFATSAAIVSGKQYWPELASTLSGSYLIFTKADDEADEVQTSLLIISDQPCGNGVPVEIYAPRPRVGTSLRTGIKSFTPYAGNAVYIDPYVYLMVERATEEPDIMVMVFMARLSRQTDLFEGWYVNTVSVASPAANGGQFLLCRFAHDRQSPLALEKEGSIGYRILSELPTSIRRRLRTFEGSVAR